MSEHGEKAARLQAGIASENTRGFLQGLEFEPLVQASAARAARQDGIGAILEFTGADAAAKAVAQGKPFAAATPPDVPQPDEKNRVQKKEQIDENEKREADADHATWRLKAWLGVRERGRQSPRKKRRNPM
jgi:hypothetical protein